MEFEKLKDFQNENLESVLGIKQLISRYFKYWWLFALSILLLIFLAYLKIKFEVPLYESTAKILIKDNESANSIGNIGALENLGLFGAGDNNLTNEMEILKSRKLINNVVDDLDLNIQYFLEDSPYDLELYPNYPILIDAVDVENFPNSIQFNSKFEVLLLGKNKFELFDFKGESLGVKTFGVSFKLDLGNENVKDIKELILNKNELNTYDYSGRKIIVQLSPMNVTEDLYMSKILVQPFDALKSEIVILSINEAVRQKGITIINNLVEQYNAEEINQKNLLSKTTSDFLDKRLNILSKELTAIEATAAQFKSNRGMVNVNPESANIYLQSSSDTESELMAMNTQLQLILFMIEEIDKRGEEDLLPGNIGLEDGGIITLIAEFNELVLQRNRIMKSSSAINPIILNIESQMEILRNNLKGSLNNLKSSVLIQLDALNRTRSNIKSKIASVPSYEKDFKEIVRGQETRNALFLFLLQKREESNLASIINVEKARIIDSATAGFGPSSPKAKIIYLVAIFFGLLLPTSFIYVKNLLDTKVHNDNDLKVLGLPHLGDIPETKTRQERLIGNLDKSKLAESLRYIRTNIGFVLDRKDDGKVIFVTSTIKGEGKTTLSINLARSFAISGKKTLLLGMDLRAPKILDYLNAEDKPGVTNFIKNPSMEFSDIVNQHPDFDNLYVVNSGDIPPNSVELLMSQRAELIFEIIKEKYDYIIVDTAPVGMVTDTIQISKFSDLMIYVVKADFLDKRMLKIPFKIIEGKKMKNVTTVLNSVDSTGESYGYGYGYGHETKESWIKKTFSFQKYFS